MVDSDGNGETDHFVTGIGYNDASNQYAFYDTWNPTDIRWKSWQVITNNESWSFWGFSTFLLQFEITANSNNTNYGNVSGDGYFEAAKTVSLTATPEVGYNFVNWTENSIEVSTSSSYSFSANGNRQLVANFKVDNTPPQTLNINDIAFNSTTNNCFDATQNIIVANDGNAVVFENGASATFIAGESIMFLPGFHAENGSSISAYITTEGSYCDQLADNIDPSNAIVKSSEINHYEKPEEQINILPSVKVYPNPNQGIFTVQFEEYTNQVEISIINLQGSVVYHLKNIQSNTFEIDLSDIARGMYLVRLSDGKNLKTKKIIIQ